MEVGQFAGLQSEDFHARECSGAGEYGRGAMSKGKALDAQGAEGGQ